MNNITHIIFDLSEVLICGLVGVEDSLHELVHEEPGEILKKFGGENLINLCRGRISEHDYLDIIIQQEKWTCSHDELKLLIRQNFHHIIEDMDLIVEKLSQNYTCILLSDHAREWIEYIESHHRFLNNFALRIYSFTTGHTKNNEHNFNKILNELNISAQECLFVDDSQKNVCIAQRCGIRGVVFKDQDQLIADLRSLGISI